MYCFLLYKSVVNRIARFGLRLEEVKSVYAKDISRCYFVAESLGKENKASGWKNGFEQVSQKWQVLLVKFHLGCLRLNVAFTTKMCHLNRSFFLCLPLNFILGFLYIFSFNECSIVNSMVDMLENISKLWGWLTSPLLSRSLWFPVHLHYGWDSWDNGLIRDHLTKTSKNKYKLNFETLFTRI